MRFTPVSLSVAKRLASTLSKPKSSVLVPKASTIVSPSIGYQAALRTLDYSQKRPASSNGGPVTVSFYYYDY